ncbi:MAG: O-antigen ligase family protein [Verrucomicrobiota bacterium JB024]|nr:O-antigen ligase family protein [Verrucomicrobiota bacterium JB024]
MSETQRHSADPVEAFRRRSQGSRRRPSTPIPGREWRTIAGLALLVTVGPWMLGSMKMWPQIALFAISLLTFLQLFIPAHGRDEIPRRLLGKLLRFPVFWLGLALLVYIFIQALNPSLKVVHKDIPDWVIREGTWMMVPVKHIDWLPTSVEAPFRYMNAWRSLMLWAMPLLAMWTAWIGLSNRRSVVILLWIIGLNGAALGLVGLAQQLTGAELLLWNFEIPKHVLPFSSFYYRNHAAAYLYPTLGVCLSLFFYYQGRARRRMQRSHPGIMLLLLALTISVALFASSSRGGILMGGVLLGVFALLYLLSVLRSRSLRVALEAGVLGLVLCGVGYLAMMRFVDVESVKGRFEEFVGEEGKLAGDKSSDLRVMIWKATYDMYKEHPWLGWGGGSYRWAFRNYQLKPEYEQLWRTYIVPKRSPPFYVYYSIKYAHSDLLQYLTELGVAGGALLAGLTLSWIGLAIYYIRALDSEHVMLFVGGIVALAHASFEFNLSNPTVLILVSLIVALGVTWMKLAPCLRQPDDNTETA